MRSVSAAIAERKGAACRAVPSASDPDHASRPQQPDQAEKHFLADGDATRGRSEVRSCDVEKDGASRTRNDGFHIIADDDHYIVEAILSPHLLGAGRIRKL